MPRDPSGQTQAGQTQTGQTQDNPASLVLEKDQILQALESPNSILFYLDPILNSDRKLTGYNFVGGGYGHGVGLSQTGSYRLAELGWSSEQILKFYYTNSTLAPLETSLID